MNAKCALPKPQNFRKLVELFDKEFREGEAVAAVFRLYSNNENYEEVLVKVKVLNELYSTSIRKVTSIARHIVMLKPDEKLRNSDVSMVNSIMSGHGIVTKKKGTSIRFYSFATKYCSFSKPDAFPIFDSFVEWLIYEMFIKPKHVTVKHKSKLFCYSTFQKTVDEILVLLKPERFSYKELDKGLWLWAKCIRNGKKEYRDWQEKHETLVSKVKVLLDP